MAITQIEPYYDVGTATFAASTAVAGQGTSWLTNVEPGDQIFNRLGQMAVVQSVNSNTSITLTKAFAGTVQTAQAYTIYRVPDSVRLENFSQRSVNLLKGGNVSSLASLTLAANNLIKATGAGALETFNGANLISEAAIDGTGGNWLSYFTGAGAKARTAFSAAARSLLAREDVAATSLAALTVGSRAVSNSSDSAILISRALANELAVNGHAFSDSSSFNRGPGTGNGLAYNSFDARCEVIGSYNYDHYAGFQEAPVIGGTGTIQDVIGFCSVPTISRTAVRRSGVDVYNPGGSGVINHNIGVRIRQQTRGTKNHAIYTEGSTPSYFNVMPETGAEGRKIIERGSNANGEYVRFADGTQICTATVVSRPSANGVSGAILNVTATYSMPAVFSAPSSVSLVWRYRTGDLDLRANPSVSIYLNIDTATQWRPVLTGPPGGFTTSSTFEIQMIAIGRWF